MFDRLVSSVVKNRVLILLLMAVLVGWGIYSWRQVPVDAYPELTNNQVQILTRVPGMSPVEVEKLVTYPIEISMTNLEGVQDNRSLSQFGLSVVTLVFEEDMDPYFVRRLVSQRLNQVKEDLPAKAQPSLGPLSTALGQVYQYALVDKKDDGRTYSARELRTMQDWILAPELRTVEGVVEANALGGFVKQYHVRFDPEQLVNHDLSLDTAYEALRNSNQNSGGNYIVRNDQQYVVRGVGRLGAKGGDIIEDIENTVITSRNGTPILVRDVATVQVDHAVRHGAASVNGRGETVVGIVMMRRGANAQQVVNNVQAKMEDLKQALPPGVGVEVFYNRNELTSAAISTVTTSLLIGGVLVILVLLGFLGDWRSALIVSLVLPMTALATFILMNYFGFKANLMSLGGLAIGLGMFVDGAIVMVENIYRLREQDPDESIGLIVVRAGREVARPIAFSVGVVIAVFLPLFTLQNLEGRMFRPMAFTVSFALMAALFLALTMAPALSSYLLASVGQSDDKEAPPVNEGGGEEEGTLPENGAPAGGTGSTNRFVAWLKAGYEPLLDTALAHRWKTVGVSVLLLGVGAGVFTTLGTEFAPPLEEGSVAIQVALEPDAALETSTDVQTKVENALLEFPEVTKAVSKTGRPAVAFDPMGQNLTDMFVGLTPRNTWRFDSKEALVDSLRARVNQIPGANFAFTQPIALRLDEMVSGAKSEIAIKIFGPDLDELKRLQSAVADAVSDIRGAADVLPSQIAGFGYVEVTIRRDDAARYGLNVGTIQRAIDMAIGGERVSTILEGDRRFSLVGKFQETSRGSVESIRNLPMRTPDGAQIRLRDVATVELTEAPAEVSREQGERKITLGINLSGRDAGSFVAEAKEAVRNEVSFPAGYTVDWGGQFENQQRSRERLMLIMPITLAIVFVLLYMTFNSISQAILVFLNIPVSIVGGILLLWAMGLYMSVPASVGFIAVLGIAVQNGVVMISFIDNLRQRGQSLVDAVREGALLRLRPILMTTLTTLLGLLPLLVAEGIGANVQRPLAAVVVGGIFTLVPSTLLLLPILYGWFNPETRTETAIAREVEAGEEAQLRGSVAS
ncbi:cation transporter [Salinibacter sp. 10B]|uniref:efflux RND transporter permease subunit n=1 Tax=Salinibacter sp. 10B TaxID=1923971 RepID=UPI000CF4521C|nr:efflux RND transporter permease subunit [Salinibacter sp. 10B]PQJ35191.1 cation transporter [Salinibacter sp. 10B]